MTTFQYIRRHRKTNPTLSHTVTILLMRCYLPICIGLVAFLICAPPTQAADIWVTDLTDDTDTANGTCNLREAIQSAETNTNVDACVRTGSGSDTIYFGRTGLINLIQALPTLTQALRIIGPGAGLLTIDANGFARVLHIEPAANSTWYICGITLTDGDAGSSFGRNGGGLLFDSSNGDGTVTLEDVVITGNNGYEGGGIFHENGTLIIRRSTISDNTAVNAGGGIFAEETAGEVTIENSTISGNSAAFGGGLFNGQEVTITASTISGNFSEGNGGGIVHFDSDGSVDLTITHSTITANTAASDLSGGDGGGLYFNNALAFTIKNTIIAGNFDLDPTPNDRVDVSIPSLVPVTSQGYNLIGSNAGATTPFPAGNPNANNDYVGTLASPIVANLGVLQDNGGPTFTHQPTGMAFELVDQGSCSGEEYDQRGMAGNIDIPFRPRDLATANADDGCDIGAVELAGSTVPPTYDIKVLLDGPYTNILMNTDLNTAGQLPSAQPYNTAPWGYGGGENLTAIPNDMVDWILVEFNRGGPLDPGGFATSSRRAFYLENNGDVSVADAGFTPYRPDPGHYYITIRHRNHLAAMSAKPVQLVWGELFAYDFRTSAGASYANGGLAIRDRGDGFFTMWGGDGDANNSTTAFDFLNEWLPINGTPPSYNGGDFNLDGSGTAFDFLNVWLPANGQASQVPGP